MTSIIKVNNIQNSSGTAAVTIDGSSNVTFPQNATITGNTTISGNTTVTGNTTLNGTVTGDNNHLVKIFSSISTSAVTKVETDTISSTYDNYLLIGNVVATDGENSSIDIYLRKDGSSLASTGNDSVNVYQGEWFNRAGDAGVSGNILSAANAYLRLPATQNIYGGSVMSFQVQFNLLRSGLRTGQTNLTNPTHRLIRNGWYNWAMQSTSSSDYYGAQGWFRFDNPNENINTITGLKINSGASNFVKHNVALYGYVK